MNRTQTFSSTAYIQPIDDLITQFQTNLNDGLSESEIEKKFLRYGYNELPKIKKSLWKIYLAPIFNFLIIILIISGGIVILLGDQTSTIITFTVVIINSITVIT
ncbi:MAG: cation-transporting P-type ATPase, partial [Promethearchaeota archaeon]